MADGGIRVRTSTQVAVLTRAYIIGHIAREIAAVFDPSTLVLETVLRGFSEAYLQQFELLLYDDQRRSVGYVSVEVDWETHAVAVRKGEGKELFRLDPSASVTGQVAPALRKAVAYMAAMAEEIGVASCEAVYTYRPGRRDEGRKTLETSPLSDEKAAELKKVRSRVDLVISPAEVSEMTVTFGVDPGARTPDATARPDEG